MRDGEPNVYAALATLRNGYLQMQWSRVQMSAVFNTVALPLLFGAQQSDYTKLSLCGVAVGLHLLVMQAVIRADQWITFLDDKMAALEKADWDNSNSIRVKIFSHREFHEKRQSFFASRRMFGLLGILVGVVWLWNLVKFAKIVAG